MPEERMIKRVCKWKPMLTRPLGRPKNRWEDVINDTKKLKIKIWTGCIQDRNNGNYMFRRPQNVQRMKL
jgi:hypothetical protein